jgi:hypothetical protein
MIQWLDHVDIFNHFFSGSVHQEVIKKSNYLLMFLYQNGRFKEKQLNQMWDVATKKHEAYKVVIFNLLKYMVEQVVETDEIRMIFHKVQCIAPKDQDKFSLTLLKAIAKRLAPFNKSNPRTAAQ